MKHLFLSSKKIFHFAFRNVVLLSFFAGTISLVRSGFCAGFVGNAYVTTSDPTGVLGWNPTAKALTVECWFKISIPSGTNLTDNMTILANPQNGTQSGVHGYLIWFNIATGNVEFSCRGNSGGYTNVLITRPYVERWYHVAVVRSSDQFDAYVDGRDLQWQSGPTVGDSSSANGLSVGSWAGSKNLFGEVQEVAIYQRTLSQPEIEDNLFADQSAQPNLTGYFKLGYSTNVFDELKNFVPNPAQGIGSLTQNGPVTFDQTDKAGEQSAYDAYRDGGREAVAPLSGAYSWQQTSFPRPTPGIAYDFRFGYSSANAFGGYLLGKTDPYNKEIGIIGNGWRHTFQVRILQGQYFEPSGSQLSIGVMNWNGAIDTWDRQISTNNLGYIQYGTNFFTRDDEYRGELVDRGSDLGLYQWTTPDRLVYSFLDPFHYPLVMAGRLVKIQDFNGNSVQLHWNQSIGVLTQVVDSASGTYNFNYNASYFLTNITFGQWQINFAYDDAPRLVSKSITNTSGLYQNIATTWRFEYYTNGASSNLLARIIDPSGRTNIFVQYDQYGRETNEVDALARATVARYGSPGNRQITRIDPGTNSWVETYDRKGHILAQQDPLSNTTTYTYDEHGNRTGITEPLGWKTTFGYDNRANVIAKTNAVGEVTLWKFDDFFNKAIEQITPQPLDSHGWITWTNFYAYDSGGNLTNNSDALGTLVSYTYYTNGLVSTATDANGHVSSFRYDTNGFLIAQTDAATNTTTYVVNEVDWKMREVDALGDRTTYNYDLNGHATRIQDPISRVFYRTYDADGNLLSATDGKEQLTTYNYDAANQKTNMIDRTGTNSWNYFYTSRGKLDHVTDPLGNSVTNFYDAANRLVRVTDPLGQSVTNQYDADGNLLAFIDKVGQRWLKGYDRLDRLVSETDPLGNAQTTTYDVAGHIQQIKSPNGYPSTHDYDGRGRLTKWVDAMGFPWLYAYDGVGNITNITDALGGHYIMTYGPRNERILEHNQDGFEWHYAYDELLRLKQQTDPNGVIRTPTYDNAGRVLFVDYSTGRRDSFTPDFNDNPQQISRRFAGLTTTIQLVYDPLDHVIEQDDTFDKQVLYGHDSLGRVVSITYPDGKTLTNQYDALGRLTNQVDWANRQTSYGYDAADRLIYRSYPNGIVQTNTFDTGGRITGLSCSAPNPPPTTNQLIQIALAYAYDRNGNKTGTSESGTLNWPQPSLTDERSSFTPGGRLSARQIQNNSSNQLSSIGYLYDSSGNMTNAVEMIGGTNVESWSLAYDEDNRTTSICWKLGALCQRDITNRYDALGRRVAKIADGVTNGYVLSLAGGMERVLCDLDSDGNITAWYVHGPDLCYRIDTTNGLICYHADAVGNIIALSDGNTNCIAQYAYTPYGRSLGSTNFQSEISNPYLFVGSQGVTEDLPGLDFMRARYYLADGGVFLSTDPMKKIGANWRPVAFTYSADSPLTAIDPSGNSFVVMLGGAVNATAAATVGGQLGGTGGLAVELPSGKSIGFACVSAGVAFGGEAGASEGFDAEFYPHSTLDEINGSVSAYNGIEGGFLARGGVDQVTDKTGNTGFALQLSFQQGGGGSYHAGLVKCATIPGTEGNIYNALNPLLEPDHSFDANGGTVAGSTRMLAGIQTQSPQSTTPSFQFNGQNYAGGGGSYSISSGGGSGSLTGPAVGAANTASLFNFGSNNGAQPSGQSGSTSGGGTGGQFNLIQNNRADPTSTPMFNSSSQSSSSSSASNSSNSSSGGGWFGSLLGAFGIHWP